MVYLLKIRFIYYINMVFVAMTLPLAICALYAHYSGRTYNIETYVENDEGEGMNVTRINGNIVEYFGDYCNETNIPLLTITHTFTTYTPTKWFFRIGTAFDTLHLVFILPAIFYSMFTEPEFIESSRLAKGLVKKLATLAGVFESVGFLAAIGIVFCLDVYTNDERPDLNVLNVPTPTWHWKVHVFCYMIMVSSYVACSLVFMFLLFSLQDQGVKDRHGYKPKLVLVTLTAVCGICSIMYLFADSAKCEDGLNFKFAVHEYIFVYGSFVLLAMYPRYYKDYYVSICLSKTCEHPDRVQGGEDCHMLKYHPQSTTSSI